jgi:DNA-binding response OmpR family regulator
MEKMQILVVDDDREIAGAIAKLLRLEGFEAIEAHDGREALKLMEQEDFKLVIMDIMMPQLDGLSATIRIRDSKNIPIIMLSALQIFQLNQHYPKSLLR